MCSAAKCIFTPVVGFYGLARRQGNYGESLYSCCERVSMPPFNCPSMLTSSWTPQFLSNMLDKSLVVFWFERSIEQNCHSGQQLLWLRPVEHYRQTKTNSSGTAKSVILSSTLLHCFCSVLYFGLCPPSVLPFRPWNLMWKKPNPFFSVLEAAYVRQKGAVPLIKNRATGFLQILHHTQTHTNTVTLQCFARFQLNLI